MPVTFEILNQPEMIYFHWMAQVELEDVLAVVATCTGHPDFRPGLPVLIDCSGWTETDMGYDQMRALRQADRVLYGNSKTLPRCAFFAPSGLQYGMARIYSSLAELSGDVEAGVFETLDEALGYLFEDMENTAHTPLAVG